MTLGPVSLGQPDRGELRLGRGDFLLPTPFPFIVLYVSVVGPQLAACSLLLLLRLLLLL